MNPSFISGAHALVVGGVPRPGADGEFMLRLQWGPRLKGKWWSFYIKVRHDWPIKMFTAF